MMIVGISGRETGEGAWGRSSASLALSGAPDSETVGNESYSHFHH